MPWMECRRMLSWVGWRKIAANGAAGKRCPGGVSVLTRWFAGAQRRQRVPLTRRPVRRSRSDRRTTTLSRRGREGLVPRNDCCGPGLLQRLVRRREYQRCEAIHLRERELLRPAVPLLRDDRPPVLREPDDRGLCK